MFSQVKKNLKVWYTCSCPKAKVGCHGALSVLTAVAPNQTKLIVCMTVMVSLCHSQKLTVVKSVCKTVGEFSLICCTSMAHAGNTKIWTKIISTYAKKCSITGFSSLRGGGGAKNASIYALSRHERIEKRSEK